MSSQGLKCPECGADMVLRQSKFKNPFFWGCSQYPECQSSHGAHPDGRPLGIPANRETKDWRIKAHDAFDAIWKNKQTGIKRKAAYALLAAELGVKEVHVAESDIEQCKQIISASEAIKARLEH